MNENLEDFFNILVENDKDHGNFQPMPIFNSLDNSFSNKEDLILDFFNYLVTHNVIRIGSSFNSPEMPFMTFTKFGRTLITNQGRRIALFEEFLNIFNSSEKIYV